MVHENYEKATEHFANGLSLIDNNYKLVNSIRKSVPLKVFRQIKEQIQEIQNMLSEIRLSIS